MIKAHKDILLGLGLAVFFSLVLFAIIPHAVTVPSNIKILSLRPDFWPAVLCVILIALSLLMSGIALASQLRSRSFPASGEKQISESVNLSRLKVAKSYIVMVGLLIYYVTVEPLGIIVSSILALLGLALLYGERKFTTLIPLSILLPIGLYLFFTKVANVPLPVGLIFN